MTTTTCPAGHHSGDPEWCDTCGAPIGAASPAGSVVPPTSSGSLSQVGTSLPTDPAAVACPNCAVLNPADNLFCEACGYDFTTGQTPPPPSPTSPTSPTSPAEPGAGASIGVEPAAASPTATPPAPALATAWIVIVEISTEWYALKGALADRPCPSPSTSTVAITENTSLIGRSSQSKGTRPEIAVDTDTGVSRRHAQLVVTGEHISVVDQDSTNGTFVVPAGSRPSAETVAIEPGVNVALADGDSVFLGAWTRLTVRHNA